MNQSPARPGFAASLALGAAPVTPPAASGWQMGAFALTIAPRGNH